MDCSITRADYHSDGIWGSLKSVDQSFSCLTLERAFNPPTGEDDIWLPLIPAGTYTCVRYKSPKFGYDVFMLKDVPGHDHCELHKANWEDQLDGCIALGESEKDSMLLNSRVAFDAFLLLQKDVTSFSLNIS